MSKQFIQERQRQRRDAIGILGALESQRSNSPSLLQCAAGELLCQIDSTNRNQRLGEPFQPCLRTFLLDPASQHLIRDLLDSQVVVVDFVAADVRVTDVELPRQASPVFAEVFCHDQNYVTVNQTIRN